MRARTVAPVDSPPFARVRNGQKQQGRLRFWSRTGLYRQFLEIVPAASLTFSQFEFCPYYRSTLFAAIFNSAYNFSFVASPQIEAVDRIILMAGIEMVRGSLFVGVPPAMVNEQPRFFRSLVQCCYLIGGKRHCRMTQRPIFALVAFPQCVSSAIPEYTKKT